MREILFRGKRVDNGEWVYGNLVEWLNETKDVSIIAHPFGCCIDEVGNLVLIEEPFVCKVHPETIGQYTGRRDKNGVKLFDGDIFTLGDANIKHITIWHDNGFMGKQIGTKGSMVGLTHWEDRIEIIGNIHDEEEDDEV